MLTLYYLSTHIFTSSEMTMRLQNICKTEPCGFDKSSVTSMTVGVLLGRKKKLAILVFIYDTKNVLPTYAVFFLQLYTCTCV